MHVCLFDIDGTLLASGGAGKAALERALCDAFVVEPSPERLPSSRRHLNGSVRLERIWVIGDTPLDIRCARCIGVRVAAVGTGWHSLDELAAEQPDLLLPDLSDPAPLLSLWV